MKCFTPLPPKKLFRDKQHQGFQYTFIFFSVHWNKFYEWILHVLFVNQVWTYTLTFMDSSNDLLNCQHLNWWYRQRTSHYNWTQPNWKVSNFRCQKGTCISYLPYIYIHNLFQMCHISYKFCVLLKCSNK